VAARLPLPRVTSVCFHPSGQSLFAAGNAQIMCWPLTYPKDAPADRPPSMGPPRVVAQSDPDMSCARLDREGRFLAFLAAPSDVAGRALALDLSTDQPIPHLIGRHVFAWSLALSPNGRLAATGTWHSHKVRVWDTTTGHSIHELPGRTAHVAFSPDGRLLAVSTNCENAVYEVGESELRLRGRLPCGGEAALGPVAFSRDGRMLALTHASRVVRLVDASTLKELALLTPAHPDVVGWLAFSPDGHYLAATTENHVTFLWDLAAMRRTLAELDVDWMD
jgi:WD40 repeat protein